MPYDSEYKKYSQKFKSVNLLGMETLAECCQRYTLTQGTEVFLTDELRAIVDSKELTQLPLNTRYQIFFKVEDEIGNQATIREVSLGKAERKYNSFLLEYNQGEDGLAIIYFKDNNDSTKGEALCNLYILPNTSLKTLPYNIISQEKGVMMAIKVPTEGIVKLKITLQTQPSGELFYKVFGIEFRLKNVSEAERSQMKGVLESQNTERLAFYYGQMSKFVAENTFMILLEDSIVDGKPKKVVKGTSLVLGNGQERSYPIESLNVKDLEHESTVEGVKALMVSLFKMAQTI